MTRAFKWPGRVEGSASLCVFAEWAKQMTEFMTYRQAPNITFPRCLVNRTSFHIAIHIACLPYISRSINHAKQTSIALCVANKSLCTETTHHQRIASHDCLLSIRSFINTGNRLRKFKDRLWNNYSFISLVSSPAADLIPRPMLLLSDM